MTGMELSRKTYIEANYACNVLQVRKGVATCNQDSVTGYCKCVEGAFSCCGVHMHTGHGDYQPGCVVG